MYAISCSNFEFIQRWQAATFFSFKHPFTDASQQRRPSYLFPLPCTKGNLKPNCGFGNEPERLVQKCQRCWVIVIPASERYLSLGYKKESTFCPQLLVFKVVKMRNQSQTSSKQCESLLWYTRGRGYSRLPSYGLVQINKSSVLSGFPKQSESIGADSTANKRTTTTEKYSTASWKDYVNIPYLHSKSPKYPHRTKRELAMITSQEMRKA